MEATMPSSITQLAIGTAVGLAMAVAGVSVIGSAVAQSKVEPAQAIAHEALINRYESPLSEADLRLGDHQQLRRLFLGN
jgi:hypothetical protein